jgi:hypothetical protein
VLDYPATGRHDPVVRRTGALAEIVAGAEPEYRNSLQLIASFTDDLARSADVLPWRNTLLPGLDAAAIYAFIRSRQPATYFEIGSGISTQFARRAIVDGGLPTRIVAVDPSPRTSVDELCDVLMREPLELADPRLFEALRPGDIVFFDGSHRVFTGSDAAVFFLELLPQIAPGVLVGIHDVYLPDDYPASVSGRHYSEQYLLAALLLGEPAWLRLVLAADYASKRRELATELDALWIRQELKGVEQHGVALWFEVSN